jgi:CRISPR/Cas system endoribonuclease Cas6 (RAMP superfamily)
MFCLRIFTLPLPSNFFQSIVALVDQRTGEEIVAFSDSKYAVAPDD